MNIIRSIEEFSTIRDRWNRLLAESLNNNVFLTWEWLYTWWEIYSDGRTLNILILKNDQGEFIGAAPFCISKEKKYGMRFQFIDMIGSGEVCPEYLDIIVRSEYLKVVQDSLLSYLDKKLKNGTIVRCADIKDNSILHGILEILKIKSGIVIKYNIKTNNPYIILPTKIEDYNKRINYKVKSEMRRRENKLSREHGSVLFSEDSENISTSFDTFVSLHQMLWKSRGETGVFKNEKFLRFHKCVVERFSKNSWVKIYFVIVNNRHVAALYGYTYGNIFYFYQSGFDPDLKVYGIGKILLYNSICESINKKINEFDFLRGDELYKEEFAEKCRHSNDIIAYGDLWKNSVFNLLLELPGKTKEAVRNNLILKYPFMALKGLRKIILIYRKRENADTGT